MPVKTFSIADAKRRPNFYDSIATLYKISRIFGLLQFKIHISPNGKIERASVGVFEIVRLLGIVIIILTLFFFGLTSSRANSTYSHSTVIFLQDRFFWYMFLLMCLSSIILSLLFRKNFTKMLQDIIDFDKNVRNR